MVCAEDPEWQTAAVAVIDAYALGPATLVPITQGLVNLTFALTTTGGQRYVLQRLHPVFSASVNDNLAAVTTHLAQLGMLTPRLITTVDGQPCVRQGDAIWRLLSFVEGHAFDRLSGPSQARAAGTLLARFHRALARFSGQLVLERPPIHDYARHHARLHAASLVHAGHRLAADVASLSADRDRLRAALAPPALGSPRLVHGDPKVSNLLFDAQGEHAVCMIDLDTLTYMPLALELGDALRSWCNPANEDAPDARFDLELFSAAVHGYAAAASEFIRADEISAIAPATLEIHLELATRFLVDALEEQYFGWDRARYATRGDHNLARACGQLRAAESLVQQMPSVTQTVTQAFAQASRG